MSKHLASVERKNSFLTGRDLQGGATTCPEWLVLGGGRQEQKNTVEIV